MNNQHTNTQRAGDCDDVTKAERDYLTTYIITAMNMLNYRENHKNDFVRRLMQTALRCILLLKTDDMDLLEEFAERKKKRLPKKAAVFLIVYIPAAIIIFLACLPVLLGIWNNQIGNQLAVGPFILAIAFVLLVAGFAVLNRLRALNNWMTAIMTFVEWLVICGGMLATMSWLTFQ